MEATIKQFFFKITGKYVKHDKNYLELEPKEKGTVSYKDTSLLKIVIEFTDMSELSKSYWVKCNMHQTFIVLVNVVTGPILMCDTFTNTIIKLIDNEMISLVEVVHKESISLPDDIYECLIKRYGMGTILTIQLFDTATRLHNHVDVLNQELDRAMKQDPIDNDYIESLKRNISKAMGALDMLLTA